MSTPEQTGASPSTDIARLRYDGLKLNRAAITALKTGDRRGLVAAVGAELLDDSALDPRAMVVAERLAELALDVRRQKVSVLGNHEAFVRHTTAGALHQVLAPVRLSMEDGTLWQIKGRRPVCTDPQHEGRACFGNAVSERGRNGHKGQTEWKDVVIGDRNKASVTYPGYLRINATAGCNVIQPPRVMVDGEERTNPYVQRAVRKDGRPGDVLRIVVAIVVVGPAPMTGNPVIVNYTLDYEPTKDLANMLSNLANKTGWGNESDTLLHAEDVYLVNEAFHEAEKGWGYIPVGSGIGYTFNLRCRAVAQAFQAYIELQANALKKAITVARRNAMKAHPALGWHTVSIQNGAAVLAVTGWAGDDAAMRQWQSISARLQRGLDLPEVEVIDIGDVYDPEADAGQGHVEAELRPTDDDDGLDPELAARNALIEYIDQGLGMVTPRQSASLNYDPAEMTDDELQACRVRLDAMLDASL